MRLNDLPRTSGFRLAVLFMVLFTAASACLFGFLYVQTQRFQTANIDDWLTREASAPFAMPMSDVARQFDAHAQGKARRFDQIFSLYAPDGAHLAGDDLPAPAVVPVVDRPFPFSVDRAGNHWHFRGIAHRFAGGQTAIIAQNLHEAREFDETFLQVALLGGLLTIVLGLAGATVVGLGTVRRFDAVARAIQDIVRGDLSRRLPTLGTASDLDRLVHVVNGMLDDIERLMHEVKGVCDGIAHDLRTPLTRILAGLERSQRRAQTREDHAEAIEDAIAELRSVLRTFSAMLRIAELEDGARRAGFRELDLVTIARDVLDFFEPAAEDRSIALTLAYAGEGPLPLPGEASLIFDALANLIDNAIKFTPEGGAVTLSLDGRAGCVDIAVTDNGCGIPPAEREAVFARFYRSEQSRNTPGNGLGLALVAAIARLHNLETSIEAREPGTRISLHQHFERP